LRSGRKFCWNGWQVIFVVCVPVGFSAQTSRFIVWRMARSAIVIDLAGAAVVIVE